MPLPEHRRAKPADLRVLYYRFFFWFYYRFFLGLKRTQVCVCTEKEDLQLWFYYSFFCV